MTVGINPTLSQLITAVETGQRKLDEGTVDEIISAVAADGRVYKEEIEALQRLDPDKYATRTIPRETYRAFLGIASKAFERGKPNSSFVRFLLDAFTVEPPYGVFDYPPIKQAKAFGWDAMYRDLVALAQKHDAAYLEEGGGGCAWEPSTYWAVPHDVEDEYDRAVAESDDPLADVAKYLEEHYPRR